MSRIEELPDDFDEALDLNRPSSQASGIPSEAFLNSAPFPLGSKRDDVPPDLPPGMASVKSHTADEILQMMNQTPLFMTNLDEVNDADGENTELEAIRALQYEGTRSDIAQGFRERGNEMAKLKKWADGKEFYTKGIAVLTGPNKWEKGEDPEAERRKEVEIEEACYTNRALCNLELKNYRSTTLDCAAAVRLNSKNIKAYYRSSLALLALDKITEAQDTCDRGLQLDPSNSALKGVHSRVVARSKTLDDMARKRQAEQETSRKEKLILAAAFRARDIKMRTTDKPPDLEDATIHLVPDALSPESTLVFPVVLLYPMHAQSDFIKAFAETETVADHLKYIFPLPWDSQQEYKIGSVDCYMETISGGLIKAGKKLPLLKILTSGKVEIVDGLLKINVVPTGKATTWVEEMKARKCS